MYYDCVQWLWLGDQRDTCMRLFLPKSYQEIKQSTLKHNINIYKTSLITPKESQSSSMYANVLPKWIPSPLSVKDQKRKVARCFGYLIIEQGCFWIFEHFCCILFFLCLLLLRLLVMQVRQLKRSRSICTVTWLQCPKRGRSLIWIGWRVLGF